MTTPEVLRTTLPASPASAPSDTLLRNFRATLEDGWTKFDTAVPSMGKSGIFADGDYIKMKEEYDSAIQMLARIRNDDELRSNVAMRQKLDETIKVLRKHNTESDKQKAYNTALVEMETRLADLQKDVERNNTTLPAIALTSTGAVMATDPIRNVTGWVAQVFDEGAHELSKEVQKLKKNPLGKIAEFFGFTEGNIVSDFKEALFEKKSGWFDGFFAGIKLWFYGFLAKAMGVDIAKWLTPEEMRLAGLKPQTSRTQTDTGNEDVSRKLDKNYGVASLILSEIANDDAKKWHIASIYPLASMKTLKYRDMKGNIWNTALLRKKIGAGNDVTDVALLTFTKPIIDESHSLHSMIVSSFTKANPGKKIEDATLYEIIGSIGPGIRTLATMKKIDITDLAGTTEELATSFIKVDDSGEVSGELVAQAEWLNISKKVIKVLFWDRKWGFLKEGDLTTLLQDSRLTPEEKLQIENIRTFGLAFQKKLVSDTSLNFGNGSVMQAIVEKWGMNIGDVLKSYILTGGKTDFTQMTAIEKVWAYTSFFLIAGGDPEWSGALTGSLINMENLAKIVQWESIFEKIPKDVQQIMEEHFGVEAALKKIWQLAGWAADALGWFAKKSPWFAAVLTICVLFLPVFSKRTNLLSILFGKK